MDLKRQCDQINTIGGQVYMKHVLAGVVCIAMLSSLNVQGAQSKGPGSGKKTGNEEITSRQRTIIGVVALSNDSKTYTIKEKSGATHYVPSGDATKFRFSEFECLDVKADCAMKNGDIASVRTVDVLDKAAWKAKQVELKEAAEKAAAEKKAAAQPKKKTP